MNKTQPVHDPYHGVGGRYVLNDKGERVPVTDAEPAPVKTDPKPKRKEKHA